MPVGNAVFDKLEHALSNPKASKASVMKAINETLCMFGKQEMTIVTNSSSSKVVKSKHAKKIDTSGAAQSYEEEDEESMTLKDLRKKKNKKVSSPTSLFSSNFPLSAAL
jgi:vacuolar-type H+-ATPase subunit E/Vma4